MDYEVRLTTEGEVELYAAEIEGEDWGE